MGLDMSLFKIKRGETDLYNGDEIAYWRKANAIHGWLVKNVQNSVDDCGRYEVSKGRLEELLRLCRIVKAHSKLVDGKIRNGRTFKNGEFVDIWEDGKIIEDPSIAEKLLPTEPGFFFGNTDYNEFYLRKIEGTIDILERVLEETDFDNYAVYYVSSW